MSALSVGQVQLLPVSVGSGRPVEHPQPQLPVLVVQAQQLPANPWLRPDNQDKVQQQVQWALVASMLLVLLQQVGTLSRSQQSTALHAHQSKSTAIWRTRTSDSALKWKTVSGFSINKKLSWTLAIKSFVFWIS